ncbi:exodeoxyribonuclease VII large subunit [Candidatus Poribacteria bacterium]|nr:exodeoxyribonuclease VII large subunit [Candidatus Poribacteria bacterium]
MDLFEVDPRRIYKVSEVTRIIRDVLEESPVSTLWVEGEVSNVSRPASGHIYFSLKDSRSQIRCVIFKNSVNRLKFKPENGISVLLYGNISVYEPRGEYQIIGTRLEPLGLGSLQLAFEQLKERLEKEGLFAPENKAPIPLIPKRVGVVTSATGAAIRDILNVMGRRFSSVSVLLYPVTVQGDGAAREIAEAIFTLNEIGDIDVLIVGRGGGSIEDLWAFNEEIVARSIYESKIPVISAVGHEIDFTIADFVADHRAPTPSAAAELVVANKADLINKLENLRARLFSSINNQQNILHQRVGNAEKRLMARDSREIINSQRQKIDEQISRLQRTLTNTIQHWRKDFQNSSEKLRYVGLPSRIKNMKRVKENFEKRLNVSIKHIMDARQKSFKSLVAQLNALSPLDVLQRGYSICYKHPDGELVTDANQISTGEKLELKLAKGRVLCRADEILQ